MKRLYYDNPLYARIMALDHAVYYVMSEEESRFQHQQWEDHGIIVQNMFSVVDPACYHVFEPQLGDVVTNGPYYYTVSEFQHMHTLSVSEARGKIIIQRRGLPFYMPKEEA